MIPVYHMFLITNICFLVVHIYVQCLISIKLTLTNLKWVLRGPRRYEVALTKILKFESWEKFTAFVHDVHI